MGTEKEETRAAGQVARNDMSFQSGDVLRGGRYEIDRLLGPGLDKAVYLAHDRMLGCPVALDVIPNDALMSSGLTVSAWETLVLGQLGDHRNIGTVLERWEETGAAFMVSRYLSGGSLRDLIARRRESGEPLLPEEILRWATEISRGLAHIHERGMLHRDLQPRNVLFDEWDTAHLVDFDLAVSLDAPEMSDISNREVIAYLAPEAMLGGRLDERADLYSLGATIYEMCSGSPPYVGSRDEILASQRDGSAAPIEREDLPEGLHRLVLSLLAIDRDQRPRRAEDVIALLDALHTPTRELERLLSSDESAVLEFKSSLRVPVREPSPGLTRKELERQLETSVLKTIAAFLNTHGGTLVIGVGPGGKVTGVEADYPRVHGHSRDSWRLTFDNVVARDLGAQATNRISLELEPFDGRTVAIVRCQPREEPTWLGGELFVRRTASTARLSPQETVAWIHERWH
jgi:serine/threonine protein kinase